MADPFSLGLICAVGSALFNGSFTVPFKAKERQQQQQQQGQQDSSSIVHPLVFTLYCALGVFISSWLALPLVVARNNNHDHEDGTYRDWSISMLGVTAGWLFVLSIAASFVAIDYIGIALAQGIWSGSATVVSYIWGAWIFQESVGSLAVSLWGLALLVVGMAGIAGSEPIATKLARKYMQREAEPLLGNTQEEQSNPGHHHHVGDNDNNSIKRRQRIWGVLWALSVGLFGGSVLAPTHYMSPQQQGMAILPSFGTGAVTLAPVILLLHSGYQCWLRGRQDVIPEMRVKQALLPGLISGCLWNLGNCLSIQAIPLIGYGVAYPFLQAAVMVSGLWGIYFFREITNRSTILVFWIGTVVLVIGAAFLAASK